MLPLIKYMEDDFLPFVAAVGSRLMVIMFKNEFNPTHRSISEQFEDIVDANEDFFGCDGGNSEVFEFYADEEVQLPLFVFVKAGREVHRYHGTDADALKAAIAVFM